MLESAEVQVISRRELFALASVHPDRLAAANVWFQTARGARWRSLMDVRRDFPTADQVKSLLIFDLRGNRYRLIVRVNYEGQRLYIKELLTHAGYDRRRWLKWL